MKHKLKEIKIHNDTNNHVKMVEEINEYGDSFWNDYFIYLCTISSIKDAAKSYNEVLKFFL